MTNIKSQCASFSKLSITPEMTDVLSKLQIQPEHESQYFKNYNLVRERFKKRLSSVLSLEAIKRAYFGSCKKK